MTKPAARLTRSPPPPISSLTGGLRPHRLVQIDGAPDADEHDVTGRKGLWDAGLHDDSCAVRDESRHRVPAWALTERPATP